MNTRAEQYYYYFIFVLILPCHVFAGLQFWIKLPELEAPPTWIGQFYFLLGVSCLLSLVLFFYKHAEIGAKLCFAAKIVVFILIGYGEGGYLGIEFTLLIWLILEISAYFRLVPSIILTCALIGITLLNQQPIEAWDVQLSGVSLHDLLSLAVYATIVATVANALHGVVKYLDAQTHIANRLNNTVSQLIDANMGFQEYAATASERSAVLERKRLSRDIHDTSVHTFINMIMLAETVIDAMKPDEKKVLQTLQQLIDIAKEGVRDTRQALRELRAIDEALPKGIKAIHQLSKVFAEATGVQVHVDYGNVPWEISPDIDLTLYRIIQESLSNAFRHGKATVINMRLEIVEIASTSELVLRIRDNGQGAGQVIKGIGLQGMQERLQKFSGQLTAKNVPDGFEVMARIPLQQEVS
jgi:signal transduction histidine kinase